MKKIISILFLIGLPIWASSQNSFNSLKSQPKPKPKYQKNVDWCAKAGEKGSDAELNLAKNRIDNAPNDDYSQVDIADLLDAHEADILAEHDRSEIKPPKFTAAEKRKISDYEGHPVFIEGYLMFRKNKGGEREKGETCNCHKLEFEHVDYHLWVTKKPGEPLQRNAVVAELAPRVRSLPNHKARWNNQANLQKDLNYLAANKVKLRIYGWLLFDGEHKEQLPKTGRAEKDIHRGTLWEVHPVMKIEKWEGGRWVEW